MSLEKQCNGTAFIPHNQRKDTAVIMGKLTQYYFPNRTGDLPPPLEAWTGFHAQTGGLQAIGNAKPSNPLDPGDPPGTPDGVLNRGPLDRDAFTKQVGEARMLIGIGMPAISPSPYLAFYNRHDVQSLYAAVRKARANPIDPFIPDEMRYANVARLTLQAVNRDYRALAREIQRERRHVYGEDAVDAVIPDHVRETLFSRGWGMRMMRDGTVGKTL
ncbi:hypothetical protein QFC22_006259 [Naganishia vaughanmartiniae]|uniref:Uncharacterized protein n=1 Tax=Naganishia vaughanmartiniae TaxID=1424756 RepID=A0ACC2WLA4_9TREE|nr:hypothetical protein QFC22_006259 [Naganishia vaughanmartiniae]